jgi:hypothetical protein
VLITAPSSVLTTAPSSSPQVRELKVLLRAHGVSEVEVVEKEELVQVIYALQQSAIKPEG